MTDEINNKMAEIHVALNQIVGEISRLQTRQLEMSDLLIEASNSDLSLEDVSDLQNNLLKDQEYLTDFIKIITNNTIDPRVDEQGLRAGGNLTRLRTIAKS